MSTRSPVLFLVFNRPETTERVFEAIRQARPPRLYVAADGPRAGRAGEDELCEAVRRIATTVDWPCELFTLLRGENLGCRRAVSSAITWFFENEPEGIILEDDCLPDPSFFAYCDDLLEHHREDDRVMCISGDNFIASHWQPAESYYFSRYAHIWGWASWARAWRHYSVDLDVSGTSSIDTVLDRTFQHSPHVRAHWRGLLQRVGAGQIDTWDYQWAFALWSRGAVSCMPRVNMISNIGFGAGATHTTSPESKLAGLPVQAIEQPLRHPMQIAVATAADEWTESHVFEIRPRNAARRLASRVLAALRRSAGRSGGSGN